MNSNNNNDYLENFEDHPDFVNIINQMGKEAGEKARREAKALGLSLTYAKGDKIIKEYPDGTIEIVGSIERSAIPVQEIEKKLDGKEDK